MQGEEGKADVYFDDADWWKIRSDKKETSCTQVNTNTLYQSINYLMVPHNTQFQFRSIKLAKYTTEVNMSVPRSEVYMLLHKMIPTSIQRPNPSHRVY